MSAPRSVSVNALRMLAAGSRQARYLHMTGPATFPSRALTGEKSIAALTSEAKKSVGERPQMATVSDKTSSQSRTFNTSRTLKQVNDSSTIDFTYLPAMTYTSYDDEIRVPLIYGVARPSDSNISAHEVIDGQVHRPLITTASQDASHVSTSNALAETKHDGLGEMFEDAKAKAEELMKEPEKVKGFFATMWNGIVDDVFGKKVAKMVKA